MKKSLTAILAALFVLVAAVAAFAERSPVLVTHTLTGYSRGATDVTLEYSLQVLNQENFPLTDLTLTLVPRLPLVPSKSVVSVPTLAPSGSTAVTVKIVTPLLLSREGFARTSLQFGGKYTDVSGKTVEFPVRSMPGGTK